MSQYPFMQQVALLALSASTFTPTMAAENDAATRDTIKAISRDYVKSQRSSVFKDPENDTNGALPSIASSNVARGNTRPAFEEQACPSAPSRLATAAASIGFGLLSGRFYGPADPAQLCSKTFAISPTNDRNLYPFYIERNQSYLEVD